MLRRYTVIALCAGSLIVASPSSLFAADDEKPELVSRAGGGGAKKQWESVEAQQKAADAGEPDAAYEVGESLLAPGNGKAPDIPRALAYLEKSSAAGKSAAAFRLGKLYDDGDIVEKNYPKAMEYYLAAARAGEAEAQYNLGAMYASARGVKRDFAEGLAWFILAGKNGAQGDGETRVRERLRAAKRDDLVAAAETRAAVLAKDMAPPRPVTPVVAPPAPPRSSATSSGESSGKPRIKPQPPKARPIPLPRVQPQPLVTPPPRS